MQNQDLVFTVKLENNWIKNTIRRLLAGERHETVQPIVLLSPSPEHFNLYTKSEHTGNAGFSQVNDRRLASLLCFRVPGYLIWTRNLSMQVKQASRR